ncbi:FHA domain-containing protein [Paenarthrobacter ureafaciens]|uniref:FHA domain-containing protein n=1 Tax=Paenarthrobacter ureafaciens TaxID=37931 RepID=UPI001FB22873|nr:FHA domain-containing protein [Paenarthrobacter ureafaciens]UOD82526.1 hypothetical protein MQZ73_06630 [Paenarthrobacter ureafaciens]WNZ02226.1 hypothetical protein PVT25_11170 [Paenarthrobacter ureafaciens]
MASNGVPAVARYRHGDWFGVLRRGTVVLLGPETPESLVESVWELLASAPEAHEVLHEVTEAFGVSLTRIPPFGIIDSKDQLRVFLRGDLDLEVHSATGGEQLSGRDVSTWTERRLQSPDSFSLRIGSGGTTTAAGTVPLGLPVVEGVVRLAALEVVLAGVPAAAPAPGTETPAADAEPVVSPADAEPVVAPASGWVSDETVLGYTDVDLGLTIAPHTDGLPVVAGPEAAGASAPETAPGPESTDDSPIEDESAGAGPAEDVVPGEDPSDEFQPDESVDPPAAAEASEESGGVPVHTSTTDPMVPTLETTTNYDHLWDKTVMRNIEDAAVRIVGDEDDHDVPAAQVPSPPIPEGVPLPAPKRADAESDGAAEGGTGVVPGPPGAVPGTGDGSAGQAPLGVPALIDSVPWLRSSASSEAPEPAAPVRQFTSSPPAAPAPEENDPDHDGQTIMKSSVAADVPEGTAAGGSSTGTATGQEGAGNHTTGPSVLARVCGQGHANPPTYPQCASCGLALSGDAVQVPRPRLGRMRISTGELIDLDKSLIIGRQPSVSRVQGGTMPRLIQVESPGGDISRSHVEVRLEGWHVMLCDLKATNGTVLIREGQAPRRLAQNEMAILLDGDIAELGDDISLRFEEIL